MLLLCCSKERIGLVRLSALDIDCMLALLRVTDRGLVLKLAVLSENTMLVLVNCVSMFCPLCTDAADAAAAAYKHWET